MGRVLGLIPAKGGSSRFRRKNIAKLNGLTLLQRAVIALSESSVCDQIVVSSEDSEITELAKQYGATVPFLRPSALAKDPAGVVDVILHALNEFEKSGETFETVVATLPTCPFRTSSHILEAYEIFLKNSRNNLMSVSEYEHTPYAVQVVDDEGTLQPLFPDFIGKKSQEMPKAYRANGAIHILDVERFKSSRSYYSKPLIPYIMDRQSSVDIDELPDLLMAQALIDSGRVVD